MKKFCEILSPVGNKEMLTAAVRSGADAVYLGAKDFSARRNAENFSLYELKSAVEYCHIRGVKVYLTLNILIKNHEMEKAFSLAQSAYNIGIDGIIIQDLGLADVLNRKIPDLPLHASTQLTVHSPSALDFLKKKGFKRVVVAREMSREDLIIICKRAKELDLEIEAFIHGALCMCMSGQCLLSAFLGSRSGNRGLCAGLCRLPFKAQNGTGYDLSLKDLSLMDYISEMAQMGVCSFKIEGRMKRPEYVAAATAACRQALDKGFVDITLSETLGNVFSRSGFTDGYYMNKLCRDMFGIRTKEDVVSADKAFPYLHELYRAERQSVNVGVKVKIKRDEPISLTLSDQNNTVTVFGSVPQTANNRPLTYDDVLRNIDKFGNTPYFNSGGGIDLDEGLFVSAKEINSIRRDAVEQLNQKRSQISREESKAEFEDINYKRKSDSLKLIARFENSGQIPENLEGIYGIMLPIEENPDINIPHDILKIVDIPRGIISEEIIEKRLDLFKEKGFQFVSIGNIALLEIAKRKGFKIFADTGLNISNSHTLSLMEYYGAKYAVLSPELTINEAVNVKSDIPSGIVIYGNIPLMLFKNCPIKNGTDCKNCDKKGFLTDRMGIKFPVRCRMGYSEMLNSVPIWLADRKNELDFDFGILYFTVESKDRVSEIISAYKKASIADIKHTKGLYYRGTV